MSLVALLRELREHGVELFIMDGALRYRAPGKLGSELLGKLRQRRETLIEHLRSGSELHSFPLTEPQRQLWALGRLWGDGRGELAYVESLVLRFEGRLDLVALERAAVRLVARHEALRAEIEPDGSSQTVLSWCPVRVEWLGSVPDTDEGLERLGTRLTARAGLDCAPQARLFVVEAGETNLLALVGHHVSCDGASLSILARELGVFYGEEFGELSAGLPDCVAFRDYVAARSRLRASERGKRDREYWLARLAEGENGVGRARGTERRYGGGRRTRRLALRWGELSEYAAHRGLTPFAVFLAACSIVVEPVEGTLSDWAVVTVDYREFAGCRGAVGYCSEVYPVRISAACEDFDAACRAAHRGLFESLAHHACSLADIGAALGVGRRPRFAATIVDLEALVPFAGLSPQVEFAPVFYRDSALSLELYRLPGGNLAVCCDFCAEFTPAADAESLISRLVVLIDDLRPEAGRRRLSLDPFA